MDSIDEAPQQLEHASPSDMHLPLAAFGNLTLDEVQKLSLELAGDARTWGTPVVLRFAGATALEWTGDRSVWLRLEGDVDRVVDIARRIPRTAQRLGLFIDRRRFRAMMAVGSVGPTTTAERLERLVDGLNALPAEQWTLRSITLLRPLFDTTGRGRTAFQELETLPFASA